MRIWDPSTGEQRRHLTDTSAVTSVAFGTTSDGTLLLATGSWDASARIWDPTTGEQRRHLTGHTGFVEAVAFGFTPGGTLLLATSSQDRSVRIWNPTTGQHFGTAATLENVAALAFGRPGQAVTRIILPEVGG